MTSTRDLVEPARRSGAVGSRAEDLPPADDAAALLGRVCEMLVSALPVAAAAVTLVDDRVRPVAAGAWPLDVQAAFAAQFERGAGPCVDVCRTGAPVLGAGTDGAGLWGPTGSARWRAVHVRPVRLDGRIAGSAVLVAARDGGLAPAELELADGMLAIAAASASALRALHESRRLAAQLQHALNSRVLIEQAKGIVSQELDVSVNEAFEILRRHARGRGERLADVASQVVEGLLRLSSREGADVTLRRGRAGAPMRRQHRGPDPQLLLRAPAALPWPATAADAAPHRGGRRDLLSIVETATPGRLLLRGEADVSTTDQLAQALGRLAEQPGDIALDLRDLTFIDACTVSLLVRTAAALPSPRRLVLRHASNGVAKVLAILGVGDHDRIRVV